MKCNGQLTLSRFKTYTGGKPSQNPYLFFFVYQHTQFVLNAAREKRDMEQRHAAIKKKVNLLFFVCLVFVLFLTTSSFVQKLAPGS